MLTPDILLLDEPTNNLDIDTIRWLQETLNQRNSTMIIISHDRYFLNSVCTHMADLDYGELRIYPGNYDEYMTAASQARERLLADNAKKKAQIAELQTFVARFSANASKAKQATSRARQIDKIKLDEVKASSRVNPYIRFEQDKKLFRNALIVENLSNGFDHPLFNNVNLIAEVGERIAILGENGAGKTTLVRTLIHDLPQKSGTIQWSENSSIGYYAQDHADDFENDMNLFDWMSQWRREGDDDQAVRAVLGECYSVPMISRSRSRCCLVASRPHAIGKLMLQKPNILVMDEPTNHLDMESIESLNNALEMYEGTLFFVSHDRAFVSSLANRIIEISARGVTDFKGRYDEFLASKGIDG
ncbi:MAG: ATP-binding cassette domain-containing protein [Shewanella fodinae]|nr:ATP-binding cassette domain-containing protein [Shewanella fodinae]